MKITSKTKICMVIGDPIAHSLSPQLHNAGYEALGIDDQFVYVACNVDVQKIEDFVNGIRAMNVRGVSCTIPHKIAVMPYLDEIDETAKKIGAVNTIINNEGVLKGYNTDWLGVVKPIEQLTAIENKTVAVIGAGGAARAAAYAIETKGGIVTIYNRTLEKAQIIAKEFSGEAYSLDQIEQVSKADIIINTTSVGLHEKNKSIISKEYINSKQIIFDAVYGKEETQLIKDAKEQGAQIITGMEMLLQQGLAQFKLYTHQDPPVDVMRKVLL